MASGKGVMTLEEICDAVRETEDRRHGYNRLADRWQCMYDLVLWSKEQREQAQLKNQYLVTSGQPRSAALLVQRLMADRPKIMVPSNLFDEKEDQDSQARGQFLELLLAAQTKNEYGVDLISALKYQSSVRGRAAVQVAWIKPLLPKAVQNERCPILIRPLDPLAIGVERDSLGTLWAFHKYEDTVRNLLARFPKAKELGEMEDDPSKCVYVIDFWWNVRSDGSVWHAVLAGSSDGKASWFLEKPVKMTGYKDVPILECYSDPIPVRDEEKKSSSIFAGWEETWEQESMLSSMLMTGVHDYLFPARIAQNEAGAPIPDIEAGGGKITQVPGGTKIQDLLTSPNVPVLDAMAGRLQRDIAQLTFPSVLYGDAGSLQAGYAVSMLSNSARGRIQGIIYPLERMLEEVFEISLCLVQHYAGPAGVALYGYDAAAKGMYGVKLTPEQIGGFYRNHVRLSPNIPGNELQLVAMYLQLVQAHVMSKRSVRDNLPLDLPSDEDERVILEIAQQDPDAIRSMAQAYAKAYYGQPLPPGEPDMKMSGPDAATLLQMEQQRLMQQQPLPNPPLTREGMVTGQGQGIQPNQVMPGSNLPPAMQGQLTPGALGLPPNLAPDIFDTLVGRGGRP